MKSALIGAAAVAAAAFATPALAQAVIEDPGYCAQFYPNANCQNLGPNNPYTNGGYYRGWQNGNAMMLHQPAEPDAYRYHGGPKSND
jgi:hypothetical protein